MDKYEFNIKVEQIKKLVGKSDYETAMKIADTIDWRRVRNTNLLSMVAMVYEKNEDYEEAREILLLAFERAPIGKRLLYKLAELALKEGNIDEAEAYYKEFSDLVSDDPRQQLLRYMILKAKGAPAQQLIHSLESYTSQEIDEKWLYELAELYSLAGMADRCVETCDKIMLMFGLGKYVEKAMELKIQYAPLTSYQMDLVENRDKYEAKLRAVEQEYGIGGNRMNVPEQGEEYYDEGNQEIPMPEQPDYGDLAARMQEAQVQEGLAREMSRISYEEPQEPEPYMRRERTRVLDDIRRINRPVTMESEYDMPMAAAGETAAAYVEDEIYTDGMYDDNGYGGNEATGSGYVGGGYADDRYADGGYENDRYAGGGYANDRYAGGGLADDGYAGGEYADGGPANEEYAGDGYADGRYTEAGFADDDYEDGEYTDGGYADDGFAGEDSVRMTSSDRYGINSSGAGTVGSVAGAAARTSGAAVAAMGAVAGGMETAAGTAGVAGRTAGTVVPMPGLPGRVTSGMPRPRGTVRMPEPVEEVLAEPVIEDDYAYEQDPDQQYAEIPAPIYDQQEYAYKEMPEEPEYETQEPNIPEEAEEQLEFEDLDTEEPEEEQPVLNHLMIEARTPEKGLKIAIEALKQIHKESGIKNTVAKITGGKLSKRGVLASAEKLAGKDLIIEEAGDLTDEALLELNEMMNRDTSGMIVVLIDNPKQMETLHLSHPTLASKFECIGSGEEEIQDSFDGEKVMSQVSVQKGHAESTPEMEKELESEAGPEPESVMAAGRGAVRRPLYQERETTPVRRRTVRESTMAVPYQQPSLEAEDYTANSYEMDSYEDNPYEKAGYEEALDEEPYVDEPPKKKKGLFGKRKKPVYEEMEPEEPYEDEDYYIEEPEDDSPDQPDNGPGSHGEEMDIDEFAQYACRYANEIDCSITGKSMLALYERIEIMEEDGVPLTRTNAGGLIEEAADRAEKPSFGKRIKGIFTSKYDKDGLLILKEEHFIY